MLLRSLVWQRVEYCCYIGKCARPDGIRGEVARRSQLKFHCFRRGCASGPSYVLNFLPFSPVRAAVGARACAPRKSFSQLNESTRTKEELLQARETENI